jgi:hypothetical protein
MKTMHALVDGAVEQFLAHRDADLFFRNLFALEIPSDEYVDSEDFFRVVLDRLLRKAPAQAGPALMIALMNLSQDLTPPRPS